MFSTDAMDHFLEENEPIETINPSNGRTAKIDVMSNGTFIFISFADLERNTIVLQADFEDAPFIANALLCFKADS